MLRSGPHCGSSPAIILPNAKGIDLALHEPGMNNPGVLQASAISCHGWLARELEPSAARPFTARCVVALTIRMLQAAAAGSTNLTSERDGNASLQRGLIGHPASMAAMT